MLIVTPRDGEPADAMLARFTKLVQRDGILREVKRRRHFISNHEAERLVKQKAARKRARAARKAAERAARQR
ncbi:MAG: 30S ribosomal protein S21 [Dehalococcoidia bacterium]